MKKTFGFIIFVILTLLMFCAQLHFRPWLLLLLAIGLYISTILHEIAHALVYIMGGIRIAGIICSPFIIVFSHQFRIKILRSCFLLVGGEVIPDLYGSKSVNCCYKLTRKSLFIAPLVSLLCAALALMGFMKTGKELFFFVFISSMYIVLSSFTSEKDAYGDFAAYKNINNENLFFVNTYCNNVLMIHGGDALNKIYNDKINGLLAGINQAMLSDSERKYYHNLLFLYSSLKLAGYTIFNDLIENQISFMTYAKHDYSEEETMIVLRNSCCDKVHSKEELMPLLIFSTQFKDDLQINYLAKQTETLNGLCDNSGFLAQYYSEYIESLDFHNQFFLGWNSLENKILFKCLSLN